MDREEIERIAREAADKVTGMRCACKNLNDIFLSAIEKDIPRWGAPGSPEIQELRANLEALAKDCGYERNADGHWLQWPKQDALLEKIGPYTIIKEHDDGDLTLDTRNWGKVVVTTEGEVFYGKGGQITGESNPGEYVTIDDPGKTTFNPGEVVSREAFDEENERVKKLGEKPATRR
ncbi:hypothetical protein ES703_21966 [subsurface metagenome]